MPVWPHSSTTTRRPFFLRSINDLEAVTLEKVPFLVALKEAMLRLGAEKAMMSGSGPTVFGLVKDEETACRLKEKLRETFSQDLLLDVACTEEEYYG